MLKLVKSIFKGFMEVVLVLIPVSFAAYGGFIGNASGNMVLGIVIGLVAGLLTSIVGGGYISHIVSINDNLEQLNNNVKKGLTELLPK